MNQAQPFLDRFAFRREEYRASRTIKVGKILRILLKEIKDPGRAIVADIG